MDTLVEGNHPIGASGPTTPCSTPLCEYVRQNVTRYLAELHGHEAVNLYAIVMAEVEKPLLVAVLEHSGQNQSKAAKALGLSRSTLRKKMDQYGIG